jgi:hypothetical protein
VDDGVAWRTRFFYPDVDFENQIELYVHGQAYRSFVSATGHDHSVSVSDSTVSADNSDFNTIEETGDAFTFQNLSGGGGFQEVTSFTPSGHTTMVFADLFYAPDDANSGTHFVRLRNKDTGTVFGGDRVAFSSSSGGTFFGIIPEDCRNDTIAWEIDPRSNDLGFTVGSRYAAAGRHIHTVSISDTSTSSSTVGFDPGANIWDGIDQSPALYPDGLSVFVNGTDQGVSLGDGTGPIEEIVDLSGALTPGDWNTIELTQSTPCVAQALLAIDAYRQIGKAP